RRSLRKLSPPAREASRRWQFERNNMVDHIILTVSNVEHSLAFYEAALAPLNIKFFMPYKGENGHPDLWGFGDGKRAFFWLKQGKPDPRAIHWDSWLRTMPKSMSSTRRPSPRWPSSSRRRCESSKPMPMRCWWSEPS